MSHPLKKEVLKMQKRKSLANLNNFGTNFFFHIQTKKMHTFVPSLDAFVHK